MPDQTPLNPEALKAASVTISDRYDGNGYEGTSNEIAEDAIRAYLAVAQPVVNYAPDAHTLRKAVEAVHNETYGAHGDLAVIAVNAYLHELHLKETK